MLRTPQSQSRLPAQTQPGKNAPATRSPQQGPHASSLISSPQAPWAYLARVHKFPSLWEPDGRAASPAVGRVPDTATDKAPQNRCSIKYVTRDLPREASEGSKIASA